MGSDDHYTLHDLATDWQQIVTAVLLWIGIGWLVAAAIGNRPWPPWWAVGIFGLAAAQRIRCVVGGEVIRDGAGDTDA